jgi:FG-GAP-like repeat
MSHIRVVIALAIVFLTAQVYGQSPGCSNVVITPEPWYTYQVPFATYVASVPDAGPGATYAWTITGAAIVGAANQRTVTFTTRCERPNVYVRVTTPAGCADAGISYALNAPLTVTSIAPRWANAGTVINVTGTGFGCLTALHLLPTTGPEVVVPFTVTGPTSLTFRLPPTAPVTSTVQISNPFGRALDPQRLNSPLTLLLRDNLVGHDNTSEILTRNTNTGLTQVWWRDILGTFYPQTRRAEGSTDLDVVGVYEFPFGPNVNADIVWQSSSTRQFVVQVNGYPADSIIPRIPSPDQVLAALGDLDGLGHPEFILRNTVTGETQMWKLIGDWNTSVTTIHAGGNLGWKIVGSRDFDGDGKYDLLWRNTSSGMTLLWLMNGAAIRSSQVVHPGGNNDWQIAALGDFDADMNNDILWRHTPTGMTLLWRMNGASILQSSVIHYGGNLAWTVAGTGDFNGDARADILWRGPQGMVLQWEMNGAQIARSVVVFPTLDPAVEIESPKF